MLSDAVAAFSSLLVGFFDCVSAFVSIANLGSTPGRVGRKKGTLSGAFGGSFGLLRCWENNLRRRKGLGFSKLPV
jgi:hypothetical protein